MSHAKREIERQINSKHVQGNFGSEFSFYENGRGDGNSRQFVLEISGNQWSETEIEKTPDGIKIIIFGGCEANEFLNAVSKLNLEP